MAAQRNAFKVGVVTITVTVTFFVILLWISQRVPGEMQPLRVRFKSSPAMPTLAEGSAVFVGGQRVGKINSARLVAEPVVDEVKKTTRNDYFVMVDAEIGADLTLKTDCRVFAEGPPLGGDGVMKIDIGKASEPWPADKIIEGADPAGFAAILASLQSEFDGQNPKSLLGQIKTQLDPMAERSLMAKLLLSVDDINAMTASLARELTDAERATLLAKIHSVADNINATTATLRTEMDGSQKDKLLGKVYLAVDSLNGGLGTVAALLQNNQTTIDQSIKNIEKTTENIANATDATRPDSLMAYFTAAGERLNRSLDDINTVTKTTRDVVVLNRENINRLLINFKEASDHLKTGFKYVLRHPWRLLNPPKEGEIQQEAIFDAARAFAEAATRIDDATAQLRALAELHGGNIPTDNPDLVRIEASLRETQAQYQKAENELWRRLKVE